MFKNVPEGGGFTIFRNGGAYGGNETAVHQYELNSQVGAFEYLYESLHSDVLFQPEVQVVNPHPSIPQGKYLFPRDYFLTIEGEKLMRMEKEEFVNMGRFSSRKKTSQTSLWSAACLVGIWFGSPLPLTLTARNRNRIAQSM